MDQIFNLPSQPTDAKYGAKAYYYGLVAALFGLITGEYLTQETQSEWLFLSDVNLQSARVFHNLISLSAPAEIICLLSGEKEQDKTSLVCPMNYLVDFPAFKSQSLKVLSQDEEMMKQFS